MRLRFVGQRRSLRTEVSAHVGTAVSSVRSDGPKLDRDARASRARDRAGVAAQTPALATLDSLEAGELSGQEVVLREVMRVTLALNQRTPDRCRTGLTFSRLGGLASGWEIGWGEEVPYAWTTFAGLDVFFRVPPSSSVLRNVPPSARLDLARQLAAIEEGLDALYRDTGRGEWPYAEILRSSGRCPE